MRSETAKGMIARSHCSAIFAVPGFEGPPLPLPHMQAKAAHFAVRHVRTIDHARAATTG